MFKKIHPTAPVNQIQQVRKVVESVLAPAASDHFTRDLLLTSDQGLVTLHAGHFESFLQCRKKLALERRMPIRDQPAIELGDLVRGEDGAMVAELTRRYDSMMHSLSCPRSIKAPDFEAAALQTAQCVQTYSTSLLRKLEAGAEVNGQADDLVIHRPALSYRPFGFGSDLELRCRPTLVRFSVNTWKWSVLESSSNTYSADNEKDDNLGRLADRLLFDAYVLMNMTEFVLEKHPVPKLLHAPKPSSQRSLSPASSAQPSAESSYHPICDSSSGAMMIQPYVMVPCTLADYDLSRLRKLMVKVPLARLVVKALGSSIAPGFGSAPALSIVKDKIFEMARFAIDELKQKSETTSSLLDRNKQQISDMEFFKSSEARARLPPSPCGRQCNLNGGCQYFSPTYCLPVPVELPSISGDNWITSVPQLRIDTKFELWNRGVRTVSQLVTALKADGIGLNLAQERFIRATVERKIFVNPKKIDDWFSNIRYPAIFLDFECAQFALPPFQNLRPYDALPFQFSAHVFHRNILTEAPLTHSYIALGSKVNPMTDPRTDLWKSLQAVIAGARAEGGYRVLQEDNIARRQEGKKRGRPSREELDAKIFSGKKQTLRQKVDITALRNDYVSTISRSESKKCFGSRSDGCIIAHYASYEKKVLQKLGNFEQDTKGLVNTLLFMDTMDLTKHCILHPDAHGSNSLKKVLPALCPHLSYGNMLGEVATHGDNVAALYRRWNGEMGGTLAHPEPKDSKAIEEAALRLGQANEKWDEMAKALVTYCELDVRGMWEIARVAADLSIAAKSSNETPDADGWVGVDVNCLSNRPVVMESPIVSTRKPSATTTVEKSERNRDDDVITVGDFSFSVGSQKKREGTKKHR
jgi:hypothetical protein